MKRLFIFTLFGFFTLSFLPNDASSDTSLDPCLTKAMSDSQTYAALTQKKEIKLENLPKSFKDCVISKLKAKATYVKKCVNLACGGNSSDCEQHPGQATVPFSNGGNILEGCAKATENNYNTFN